MTESLRISAADAYALGASVTGAAARGPVVVVAGATGVRKWYYARFAAWLAGEGATVVTFDYRGIGESRPHRLRGFDARLRDWGQLDLEGVLRFARAEWPARPLVVVGHSVGGQLLGLAPAVATLSRAVTVAAQSGYWGHWPPWHRPVMAGLWWGVMPAVTAVMGYLPGRLGVGEDLPREVALEWARWGRQPRFCLDDGIAADGYARLTAPVLSFSFTDDTYAPRPAVDWLHRLFTRARVERRHLSPADAGASRVGHFGFFRDTFRDSLWPQVARFAFAPPGPVAVTVSPLPPGA